jgi:hypothetical protein
MRANVVSILLAGSVTMLAVDSAYAEKPVKTVQDFESVILIPAGTEWNSPARSGEVCDFDVAIEFHDHFVTWEYADRTREKLVFDDIFTNTATGFSFRDTANFTRVFDHASGIMVLHGIFWKTMVDEHIVVLDVGSFTLNLNLPFPQPVENLKGANHDVNSAPFGTWSYCDWLEGIFPVAR